MPRIASFHSFGEPTIRHLAREMQAYYAKVRDYPAFPAPSHHPLEWRHVVGETKRRRQTTMAPVAVLEFGSGRTGFPRFCQEHLGTGEIAAVSFTSQDVTPANQDHLQTVADHVLN